MQVEALRPGRGLRHLEAQRRQDVEQQLAIDALVVDLPTAFYITSAEIEDSTIVGQFQPETGEQEEFGMLFEKGSELVPCVNSALTALREDGTIEQLEQQWLSDVVDVPHLK